MPSDPLSTGRLAVDGDSPAGAIEASGSRVARSIQNASRLEAMLRWMAYLAVTAWHFLLVPAALRVLFKAPWAALWRHVRAWSELGSRAFGVEVGFYNPADVPLDRQYIVVANHRSWLDQLVVAQVLSRPLHFLAKRGYFEMPVFGKAIEFVAEAIPVDEQQMSPATEQRLASYLEQGDSVVFYVEGTRGSGKTLLPFHSGAFRWAARCGVPILPLYVFGTEQVMSKHRSLLSLRPGRVEVVADHPVEVSADGLAATFENFERSYRERHDLMYDRFEAAGRF